MGAAILDEAERRAAREAREAALKSAEGLHAPVLCDAVVAALAPERGGAFLDGTFGAGGYARAILEAGADQVIGLDRDPQAIARGEAWAALYEGRLTLVEATFSELDAHAPEEGLAGVALDLGVSSMQIDEGARGFSFQREGPLDMRMSCAGPSAADLVASLSEQDLADLIYRYGEDRASRRIARAIVAARGEGAIETTLRLAEIVESASPRPKPGQPHAATRTFQALRIAVNAEFDELVAGLEAAERALAPGGVLAVVTFHSLEDRIVKRYFQEAAGRTPGGSRHEPDINRGPARFELTTKGAVAPSEAEIAGNPRARSAKLRAGRRTAAPAAPIDRAGLGVPAWSRRSDAGRSGRPDAGKARRGRAR
ncbi:MAG: 16S rRNA (cytosine(1402)-N(4))-methyltransferase RsmH [Pseudomonadota bacterium]